MTGGGNQSRVDVDLSTSMIEAFNFTTSQTRIQSAAQSVPKFDGETTSLTSFVRAVTAGNQLLVAGEESRYLLLVLNRLRGAARASVEEKNFASINDLIGHLKKRYAPGRNLNSFLSEIGRLQIKKHESLRKYINRATKLYQRARAAQLEKYRRDESRKEELEDFTLENFIFGLPRGIKQEVKIRNPKTLDSGFNIVMEIERDIKNHRRARGNYDSDTSDEYRISRRDHQKGRRAKRTSYPNSPSPHNRYKEKHRRDDSSSSSSSSTSSSDEDQHRQTHGMSTRSRRDRSSSTSTATSRSRDRGYKESPERRERKKLSKKLFCWKCGEKGHDGKTCRKSKSRSPSPHSYKNRDSSRRQRHSSIESTDSLNWQGAHRAENSVSENKYNKKNPAQKNVRFAEKKTANKENNYST